MISERTQTAGQFFACPDRPNRLPPEAFIRDAGESVTVRRSTTAVVCGFAAVVAVGCQEDIRRYEVPRLAATTELPAGGEKAQVRMLVVTVPRGENTWFFKLLGPAKIVEQHQSEFDGFLRSVQFTDDANKPLTWKVPEGWQQQAESGKRGAIIQRFATFHVGPKEEQAELTVIALGREVGSLLANVNRWRGQIGLRPVSETELSFVSRPVTVNGSAGTSVDMTGAAASAAATRTPPRAGPAAPAQAPLTYTTPEGWKEIPSSGMRVAAFVIPDGDRKVEVTVVPLGGPAGGLVENVNRWRGQVGLPPASESDMRKDMREIDVAGAKASYVDLTGVAKAGGPAERIVAVVVPRGPQTWFIKIWGPADQVGKQKPAFEAFVRSIQFAGGTGANHG